MSGARIVVRVAVAVAVLLTLVAPLPAGAKGSAAYQTGSLRWRAADGDFAGWTLDGVALAGGALQFDPLTADQETDPFAPGSYNDHNFYNGGSYYVGSAVSPEVTTAFPFKEAIASWNADTPAGTWVETQIRANVGDHWTKWYNLGVWAADSTTIERHSVNLQGDADGFVAVDTLVLSKKLSASAFQLKVRLFTATNGELPTLHNLSLAYSTTPGKPAELVPGGGSAIGPLAVPECSQMVYPDGGEIWCSPTSTSMVLGYWGDGAADCQTRVFAAVDGVFDWLYDGHGNWPFNTAYAAAQGREGYVVRFESLAQAEPWLAAGVPVVVSYAWKKSDLTSAPIPSSNGHLAVLVGIDADGNPIINDPAAASDADVQRAYDRAEWETLWLSTSGGTAYLIFPAGHTTPALP
jgi:hypothetical protein